MPKFHKFEEVEFARTPNALAQDRRLSMKARGLWTYMQSMKNDWDFSIEKIAHACDKDGYEAIRTGIVELEQFGYLERKKFMTEKGGWDMEYFLLGGTPAPENPDQDNPDQLNPDQENRMNIKEEVIKETITKENNTKVAIATAPKARVDRRDPAIDNLIDSIKEVCKSQSWAYDRDRDRQSARNILTAKDFAAQAETVGLSPQEYAIQIVRASALLDFWAGKVTGPKAIYKQHSKIYNAAKEFKRTQQPQNQFQTL